MNANWSYPTRILFGAGRRDSLPAEAAALGMTRPLLVTDPGLKDLPFIQELLDLLAKAGLATGLFHDIKPNPLIQNLEAGLAVLRAGRHDGVICVGGGSAMDCGKVMAFMVAQSLPVWHFEDIGDGWTDAETQGILPIIALPTTAGTGSEVGRAGVIGDAEAGFKKIIFHPQILPAVVIEDPELSVGLPPGLTAATGFDALAHCLEAYCAPTFHPMSDGIALEGIRLIKEMLPRAVADGSDLEARGQMLVAASMGAVAFQKGLGAIHSLSHAVGALFDTHHGRTNAVMMPYVLAFNRPQIETKIDRLAAYLSLPGGFDGFFDWVMAERAALGIENSLAELIGERDRRTDRIVALAIADPTVPTNPRLLDGEAAERLYLAALAGEVAGLAD
ncbi:MAG: iron-containing alcohol dehydrogenase [Rhodospirillales bacterium]